MNNQEITLDEVLKNTFSKTCISLAGEILAKERPGFNINKNNYDLFSENEKYIMESFYILSDIKNCLSSIDNAFIFMNQPNNNQLLRQCNINLIDYSMYHYDMICYKIVTIKDLYFKLINWIYKLNIRDRDCNWNNINKKKDKIANPELFKILDCYYNSFKNIIDIRNKSAHKGEIEHIAWKQISPYMLIGKYDIDPVLRYWKENQLKNKQKEFLNEMKIYRHNSFFLTRCVLCILSNKFIDSINTEIKQNTI